MTEKTETDSTAEIIGKQVLDSADYLRLFLPGFQARFPLDYAGQRFWVRVHLDDADTHS